MSSIKNAGVNAIWFGMALNAGVAAMGASGYFNSIGVAYNPIDIPTSDLTSFQLGQGVADTLFVLIALVFNMAASFIKVLFAFPTLVSQFNWPDWLVGMVFFLNVVMYFALAAYILIGREL